MNAIRKVLVIEDDDVTAELERRILTRAGFAVTQTGRVKDAIHLVEEESFDALVLDYQLDGDPWAVVEAARRRSPALPVVLVTGMGSERVAEEALRRGVSRYLRKDEAFHEQLPQVIDQVTALASAQEQQRKSDAFFRLIAENTSDLITIADGAGLLSYVSPACRRILGFEPEEMVGQRGRDFIHPEDLSKTLVTMSQQRAEHRELRSMYRCRCKDGRYIWVEVSGQVSRDARGDVREIYSICRDVTARQEAEAELVKERARLAEAQEIALLGSWEWDVPTRQVFWSGELYRIFGQDPETFRPTYDSFFGCVHPDDRARLGERIGAALEAQGTFEADHRIVLPATGEVRVIRARGRVTLVRDGQALRMAGTGQDVTAQRALQEIAEQRAADLERSNRDLEVFAYAASHDLRAPLRAISLVASWLKEDAWETLSPGSRNHVDLLMRRSSRMERLLHDILEFSRVGRGQAATETVSLPELITEIGESLPPSSGFSLALAGEVHALRTHRVALKRTLMNLIDNAFKHHDKPRGVVQVRARDRGDAVLFEVEDDGPGIPPEHRERIFRMFETLQPKDQKGHNGMGLALVRKLVEGAGGSIAVKTGEATSGRGSIFTFTWPRAASADPSRPH